MSETDFCPCYSARVAGRGGGDVTGGRAVGGLRAQPAAVVAAGGALQPRRGAPHLPLLDAQLLSPGVVPDLCVTLEAFK